MASSINAIQKIRRILTSKEKFNFFIIICLSFFLSVSEIFSIGILVPIINLFLNPALITTSTNLRYLYKWSGTLDPQHFLSLLVTAAILLFLGKSVCGAILVYWQQKYVAEINKRLSSYILQEYLHRTYEFHLLNNSAVLFRNINNEVSVFVSHYLSPIIVILSEVVILCGIIFVVLYLYPVATIIALLGFGILLVLLNIIIKSRMTNYAKDRILYSEVYYKALMESLQSIKEIKIFNVQDYFVKKYMNSFGRYMDSVIKSNLFGAIPRYLIEALLFSTVLCAILISIKYGLNSNETIPMFAIFGVVLIRLFPSISKIQQNNNLMHYSSNSLDMVIDIIGEVAGNPHKNEAIPVINFFHDASPIRLEKVSFGYASTHTNILKDFSITIAPHTITAFIGETGTGKSTLIDIVMGLLLPQNGNMYYGNMKIDAESVDSYRTKIGYVPQTITLIDETIAANIAFGVSLSSIDNKKLRQVINLAQLYEFVNELPNGLQTIVGERGVRLSGGQRQRIGIARALYRNPEILVFDEATSALDIHTEEKIYQAIKRLDKTVIMVTHRLNTIAFADLIYVLEEGAISDKGTYAELFEKTQYFKKLSKTDYNN